MKNCSQLLIVLANLENSLQKAERLQEGSNRQTIIKAIEANIQLVAKEYEACKG